MKHIFDSHSHYTDKAFDDDREQLLEYMHENGVEFIMMASSDCEDSAYGLKISSKYDFMYNSVGLHPECVDSAPENYLEIIEKLAENPKLVLIITMKIMTVKNR